MKILPLIALVLITISISATAKPFEIETYRDLTSFEAKPKTIAVFDVSALDTLHALKVPIAGTVSNMFVDYLGDVAKSAKVVGTLFEPDFKALSIMKPDLVIVGGRSSTTFDAISKLSKTIDMTIWGNDLLEQARARTKAYGKIFDKNEAANTLIDKLNRSIDQAKIAAKNKGNALILMTNGPKISAYGPQSRFGWLYSALDIEPVKADIHASNHGDAVSYEFLLKQDPDWLFVIDRTAAIGQKAKGAKATLDNELVHKTKAWKKNQIIYLNSTDIYVATGGIQSLIGIFNQLQKALSNSKLKTANH